MAITAIYIHQLTNTHYAVVQCDHRLTIPVAERGSGSIDIYLSCIYDVICKLAPLQQVIMCTAQCIPTPAHIRKC